MRLLTDHYKSSLVLVDSRKSDISPGGWSHIRTSVADTRSASSGESAFTREDLLAARLRVSKVMPYQRSSPPFISNLSLAIVSGLLLIFAFPDWNLWSLGWVGTAPLIMAIVREQRFWRSMLLGYITGTLFYIGSSHWVTFTMHHYGELPLWLSYLVLGAFASILGIFTGLFAGMLALSILRFGGWAILAAPFIWAASEWARIAVVGVGWNALGYSQAFKPAVIQVARWGGVYLVSALLVLASTALVFGLVYLERKRGIAVLTAAGLLAIGCVVYGQSVDKPDETGTISVAVVQPNVPIAGPWNDQRFVDRLTGNHILLSEEAIRNARAAGLVDGPSANSSTELKPAGEEALRDSAADRLTDSVVDLVIWPESPMNFEYERDAELRRRIADFTGRYKTHLLMNSWAFPEGSNSHAGAYNSAMLIGPSGERVARYDKIALVPFGEYVPARNWIPFMDRIPALVYDLTAGTTLTLSDVSDARVGTLICFEATRPDLARSMRLMGASVLAQLSNELWYNSAAAARQMLAQTVFRAVENNTDLIRATNSGLSARIDAYGVVHDETPMFQAATRLWKVKTVDEARADALTFYTRYGDVFAIASVGITLLFGVAAVLPVGWERKAGTDD